MCLAAGDVDSFALLAGLFSRHNNFRHNGNRSLSRLSSIALTAHGLCLYDSYGMRKNGGV
jgi:hypothetical protein